MKSANAKDIFRQIRFSPRRFLAILSIVALGVAFFSGIQAASPDMRLSGDAYYNTSKLMDLKIVGTMGLTEDDVLGVAIVDDTVLVNFSAHMADAIRTSRLNQRMMAYQLTGALVQRYPVRRVRFFFDGEAKNTLDGDVMWAGEFLMDYVLCE